MQQWPSLFLPFLHLSAFGFCWLTLAVVVWTLTMATAAELTLALIKNLSSTL